MIAESTTIRLTIGRRDASGIVPLTAYTPGGSVTSVFVLPSDPNYQAMLARLNTLDIDGEVLRTLGNLLFKTLFPPEIHDSYRATRALLGAGQRLRIVLDIPPDATDIALAPWEYLYDVENDAPLALFDTSVVRYLPQPVRVPALDIAPPLRVLLSAAHTAPPVDVERELNAIASTLSELGDRVAVTIEPHLTVEKLQNHLRQQYHVWHFVGHGSNDADGAGQLVFEDTVGDGVALNASQIAALLAGSTVRLAVLDACGSGQIRTSPMKSIATALVAAGVPAVIAMQLPVPEETAHVFAIAFYQALAGGEPIDLCVTEGRKAVLATVNDRPDWGIPVVLTRTLDGKLFAPPPAASRPAAMASEAPVADRNRETVLKKVRTFWIDGVLHDSLAQAVTVDLGLVEQLAAVQQHWDAVLQRPGEASQQIAPGTHLSDIFDEQDQALLVLGAPGSGKTTLLLELARVLLDRADAHPNTPMPVVFNLSSWSIRHGPLADWLIEELFERYDVPRNLGRRWVEADNILPLLDGLDEVADAQRDACTMAINSFREAHGLLPICVCCRTAEYEELTIKLRLAGAVGVHLLAEEQIDGALAAGGEQLAALRSAVSADPGLRELAQTPLMLSVMMLAYRGVQAPITGGTNLDEQRARIFDAYIDAMFRRRGTPRYGRDKTLHWLGWLAHHMQQQAQSVFLIEALQPDWLPGTALRRYTLLDRLGWGSVAALLVALVITLRIGLAGLLASDVINFVVSTALLIGSATALFGGRARSPSQPMPRAQIVRDTLSGGALGWLIASVVGSIFLTPLMEGVTSPLEVIAMAGTAGGMLFVLLGGLVGRPGWDARRINVVERLRWSRQRAFGVAAGSGCIAAVLGTLGVALFIMAAAGWVDVAGRSSVGDLVGGVALGVVTGMVFGCVLGVIAALIGGLIGGFEGGDVATTTRPNQGIRRSARTAVGIGSLVAVVIGVITWPVGIVTGVIAGLLFALAYGGYAVLSHLTVRFLLWRQHALPWHLGDFLDDAADRVFLRKVGGGYIFIHRLLLEHLTTASLSTDSDIPVV